jgi:hypothetical protein
LVSPFVMVSAVVMTPSKNSRQFNSQRKCGFRRAKRQAGKTVLKSDA